MQSSKGNGTSTFVWFCSKETKNSLKISQLSKIASFQLKICSIKAMKALIENISFKNWIWFPRKKIRPTLTKKATYWQKKDKKWQSPKKTWKVSNNKLSIKNKNRLIYNSLLIQSSWLLVRITHKTIKNNERGGTQKSKRQNLAGSILVAYLALIWLSMGHHSKGFMWGRQRWNIDRYRKLITFLMKNLSKPRRHQSKDITNRNINVWFSNKNDDAYRYF